MSTDNLLISSAGRRGHLVTLLRESLATVGGGRIVAGDASPLAAAGLWLTISSSSRVTDPGFVDHMVALCERHEIGVIVPTIDPELPVYAAARERFAAIGCSVWVSSPQVVGLGTDKWHFHEWLRGRGLPSPETYEAARPARAVDHRPVITKPRSGSSRSA